MKNILALIYHITRLVTCDIAIAVSYNEELYIFGGFDGFQHVHFDDLYKFNPGEKTHIARLIF